MIADVQQLLDVAVSAALHAGEILERGFGAAMNISHKEGKHNLVTEYDVAAEKAIIEHIREHFPHHTFLAEESGASGESSEGVCWIIDPLDGTVNFAHSIPIFCVSIGVEVQGKIVCGVVYQPLLRELFTATSGGGAFLNGKRLRVSETESLTDSVLVTGFPYNIAENPSNCIAQFAHFLRMGLPIRRLGSAALDLVYTAAGRFDGFWEVSLNAWDVAAGKIILEEAGGKITHYDGSPFDIYQKKMVATNGKIHEEMLAELARETKS